MNLQDILKKGKQYGDTALKALVVAGSAVGNTTDRFTNVVVDKAKRLGNDSQIIEPKNLPEFIEKLTELKNEYVEKMGGMKPEVIKDTSSNANKISEIFDPLIKLAEFKLKNKSWISVDEMKKELKIYKSEQEKEISSVNPIDTSRFEPNPLENPHLFKNAIFSLIDRKILQKMISDGKQ